MWHSEIFATIAKFSLSLRKFRYAIAKLLIFPTSFSFHFSSFSLKFLPPMLDKILENSHELSIKQQKYDAKLDMVVEVYETCKTTKNNLETKSVVAPNLQGEDYGRQLHVVCGVILLMILQLTGTISYYPPGLHQNTSQSCPRGITIHCVPLSPVWDYQDRSRSKSPLQLLECLLTSVIPIKLYLLPGQPCHRCCYPREILSNGYRFLTVTLFNYR